MGEAVVLRCHVGNINLKWWQVLGFFVVFAGVIWFQVIRKQSHEAKDVEARVDVMRVEACQCPTQECADAVGKELSIYMKEIEDRKIEAHRVDYIAGLAALVMKCVSDPEARTAYAGTGLGSVSMDDLMTAALEERAVVGWTDEFRLSIIDGIVESSVEGLDPSMTIDEETRLVIKDSAECIVDAMAKVIPQPRLDDSEEDKLVMEKFDEDITTFMESETAQPLMEKCFDAAGKQPQSEQ